MEFLKELFGNESLTYEQLAAKVAEKKMKLADLSTGAYVGKDKYETLTADRDGLKQRLEEANGKLEGYDPEWKTKAEQAQTEADAKVNKIRRGYLLKEAAGGIKFSSESAKKAFLSDLEAAELPVQEDKVRTWRKTVTAKGKRPRKKAYGRKDSHEKRRFKGFQFIRRGRAKNHGSAWCGY